MSGGDGGARYACISCHGIDGLGNGAGAPRLAGLDAGYLARQLEHYRAGIRQHEPMRAVADALKGNDILAVSTYYQSLPVPQSAFAQFAVSRLYVDGDPQRGLASCASCHGVNGEGIGPANPPLAHQPATYLAEQLIAWREGRRRGDPLRVMSDISRKMTAAEIGRTAAYAAALPGSPRRPE